MTDDRKTIRITNETHRALKILCVDNCRQMHDVADEFIRDGVAKY